MQKSVRAICHNKFWEEYIIDSYLASLVEPAERGQAVAAINLEYTLQWKKKKCTYYSIATDLWWYYEVYPYLRWKVELEMENPSLCETQAYNNKLLLESWSMKMQFDDHQIWGECCSYRWGVVANHLPARPPVYFNVSN